MTASLKFMCEVLLSDESNFIVIHVDKKSNISHFNELNDGRIVYLSKRIDISWGDISMILATISLLKYIKRDGYYTLLSGDDFPCVDLNSINSFFGKLNGENLVHFQDERNNIVDVNKRFNYRYPKFYFNKTKTFKSKLMIKLYEKYPLFKNHRGIDFLKKNNIDLYKGTQWFSLSSASLEHIINYLDSNPGYLDSFDKTFCPDEMFFQTLVKHLRLPVYHDSFAFNDCLRYIDWKSGPDYPRMLTTEDFVKIRDSGCLFARKASSELSPTDFNELIS